LPQRKCIGCEKIKNSAEMIRIMKTHNTQELLINPDLHNFGRSSYLCYNIECIQNALKRKKLQRTLKKEIPVTVIEQIKNLIDN